VPGPTARPSGSTAPCCPSSLTPNPGCPTTNDSPPSTPGSIATTLDAPTPLSVADPQPPDSPPNCQQPPGSVQLGGGEVVHIVVQNSPVLRLISALSRAGGPPGGAPIV